MYSYECECLLQVLAMQKHKHTEQRDELDTRGHEALLHVAVERADALLAARLLLQTQPLVVLQLRALLLELQLHVCDKHCITNGSPKLYCTYEYYMHHATKGNDIIFILIFDLLHNS